jgi:glyoxylase-like metal-dependent hydrolase (beta-lactamase superfamily II)/rhodanese-related sulfurtransferase
MKIEQIYTGCLAQGAYYIQSEGEAVVIDPLRETKPYLDRAREDNASIKYILETHFHADFVSGHVELAQKSGATIIYGPHARTSFDTHIAKDGEILQVGALTIKVLHTPGHTPESSCYLLHNESGKAIALFSGDTLFLGDVGRPDLAVKSDLSEEDLAKQLYHSLRNKIMPLPDNVIVYPGHGAGSACGKNMRKETSGLLCVEKASNYALRKDMTESEFVKEVTSNLKPAPAYFPENVKLNQEGATSLQQVLNKGIRPLSVQDIDDLRLNSSILILDTRPAQIFKNAFIPGAINIGIDGNFAPWVGTLIPNINQSIVIIADPKRIKEVITRLARVGYDNVVGHLEGGFKNWTLAQKPVDSVTSIDAHQLQQKMLDASLSILDVRKTNEFLSGHILGAKNIPLYYINDQYAELDPKETYYIHCAGGYRSMIMASLLKSKGFIKLVDIQGGFKAIATSSIPTSEYLCPSTLN